MKYIKRIWNKINNQKIRDKLLVSLLILGILPSLFIGFYFYNKSYSIILDNAISSTSNTLYYINNHLTAKIEALDNIALSIVVNQNISTKLNATDSLEVGRNRRDIESTLSSFMISSSEIKDIAILDNCKNVYGLTLRPVPEDFYQYYIPFYDQTLNNNSLSNWIVSRDITLDRGFHESDPDQYSFLITAVIKNTTSYNKNAGLLLIHIKNTTFSNLINNATPANAESIMLLDNNKNLLLSSSKAYPVLDSALLDNIKGDRGSFTLKNSGKDILFNYIQNSSTGWYTISMIPMSTLTKDIRNVLQNMLILSLVLLLLVFFITFLVTYNISFGLHKLIDAMQTVKNGRFDIRVADGRTDEIGMISAQFDDMLDRLQYLINTTYEQQKHINVIQMKALQSQVSPHFLYNTLDSINWMLLEKDQQEISNVVIALGSLLRYSINTKSNMVRLSEELESVNNYMIISKMRFEERLSYTIRSDESLLNRMVPRFLIQPLVENAVVHGIEGLYKNGCIRVDCHETDENTIIVVLDNGKGIPEAVLKEILSNSGPMDDGNGKPHIGLANVIQRIKLIYGEKYGLDIKSSLGDGTKVTVLLPKGLPIT